MRTAASATADPTGFARVKRPRQGRQFASTSAAVSPASPRSPEVEQQLAVFKRGVVDLIEERELAERIERSLKTKKPLRVKFGMDPSSPDLHVGHAIPLMK